MTMHGNTTLLPIYRGTLQGDTLSPFLFTILMEPLLRWLAVGSRGYRPTYQPHPPSSAILTCDDHGYAYDISIIDGIITDLKIQLKSYTSSAHTHAYNWRPANAKPPEPFGHKATRSKVKTKSYCKNKSIPSHSRMAQESNTSHQTNLTRCSEFT